MRSHASVASLDPRIHGYGRSSRANPHSGSWSAPGSGSSSSVSTSAQNWYNPPVPVSPRSRRSAAKRAKHEQRGGVSPPIHCVHAYHHGPELDHAAVVNQQPTATLATVGPPAHRPAPSYPASHGGVGTQPGPLYPDAHRPRSSGDRRQESLKPTCRNSCSGHPHQFPHDDNPVIYPPSYSHYTRLRASPHNTLSGLPPC